MGPFHSLYCHSFAHTHICLWRACLFHTILCQSCHFVFQSGSNALVNFLPPVSFGPSKSVPHAWKSVLNNETAANREGKICEKSQRPYESMIVSPRTGPGNDPPVAGLSIDPEIFVFID